MVTIVRCGQYVYIADHNLLEDARVLDIRGYNVIDSRGTNVTRLKFVITDLQSTFILLEFTETYLISKLEFKTDTSDGFRYVVDVSKDRKSWLRVVDHSSSSCFSTQDLHFNKHAAR